MDEEACQYVATTWRWWPGSCVVLRAVFEREEETLRCCDVAGPPRTDGHCCDRRLFWVMRRADTYVRSCTGEFLSNGPRNNSDSLRLRSSPCRLSVVPFP